MFKRHDDNGLKAMKCISYVSRVKARQNGAMIPVDLSGIFRMARKKNSENNITGIMSYQSGYYIQVIEGDEQAVDQLYSNIKADPRHTQVALLFQAPIDRRSFPNWDMKLSQLISKNKEFLDFIYRYADQIAEMNSHQRQLLSVFCDAPISRAIKTRTYNGKVLKLSGWPDLVSIEPTPIIIDLCAKLMKEEVSYDQLANSGEYANKQKLNDTLNMFDALGLLVVTELITPIYVNTRPSKNNGFYSKMKNFLGLQSQNGL